MADDLATALTAADWAVNHEDPAERRRLISGHRTRRRETWDGAYRATDHTEADAWLIAEYEAAHKAPE